MQFVHTYYISRTTQAKTANLSSCIHIYCLFGNGENVKYYWGVVGGWYNKYFVFVVGINLGKYTECLIPFSTSSVYSMSRKFELLEELSSTMHHQVSVIVRGELNGSRSKREDLLSTEHCWHKEIKISSIDLFAAQ